MAQEKNLEFLETLTVEQFKKRMLVDEILVRRNPKTGMLFFTYGGKSGVVANQEIPEKPMLSFVQGEVSDDPRYKAQEGKFWMLHNEGEGAPVEKHF